MRRVRGEFFLGVERHMQAPHQAVDRLGDGGEFGGEFLVRIGARSSPWRALISLRNVPIGLKERAKVSQATIAPNGVRMTIGTRKPVAASNVSSLRRASSSATWTKTEPPTAGSV